MKIKMKMVKAGVYFGPNPDELSYLNTVAIAFDEFEEFLIDFLNHYFLVQLNCKLILMNVHFLHMFEELFQEYFLLKILYY